MTEAERRLEQTIARLAEIRNRQRSVSAMIGCAGAIIASGIIAAIDPLIATPAMHPAGFYLVYIPVATCRTLGGKLAAWTVSIPIFAVWSWLVSFDPNWLMAAGIGLICVAGFKIPAWPKSTTLARRPVPMSVREA